MYKKNRIIFLNKNNGKAHKICELKCKQENKRAEKAFGKHLIKGIQAKSRIKKGKELVEKYKRDLTDKWDFMDSKT